MRPARLHATALDLDVSPAEAVRRLAGRDRVTAWSGAWSCGSLVTCDPVRVLAAGEDPLALLAALPAVAPDPAHPDAVGGGWFGYLCFPAAAAASFPRASLGWYPDVLRHDGTRWWYEALVSGDLTAAAAAGRRAGLVRDLGTPATHAPARLALAGEPDPTAHVIAVEWCMQAIRRGEVYQANIATELELQLSGSTHDAWARLVEALGPARAGFVDDPEGTAVGASPELFLHRAGRAVRSEPIKGTRPRTGDPGTDARERRRLRTSVKDAAENVMIVDLMRNDLSRVCAPGSVTVPRLLSVEPHPGVWHLVSEVHGRLAEGRDDADLLAAAFPPGSVTGAPKMRAMALIEELEGRLRGLFSGAMGYASPLAGLELAVAIRTLEVDRGGRVRLAVGGGVTIDSTPAQEWTECLTKAAPLLRVLGGAALVEQVQVDASPNGPADPASGIFETLLVVDGRPRRLADHLRRLHRSYWECYDEPLTADVPAAVTAAAGRRAGHLRVRVDAMPGAPDRVRVSVRPCDPPVPPARQPGLVLVALVVPTGVPHKFTDRRWLEAAEAAAPAGALPLFVDEDGVVLESSRSSVFVVRGGVARTPPLDGRLLPGTARQAVLDVLDTRGASYAIAPIPVVELAGADGMFLVNAVRGVQWVREVAGVGRWPAPDPVTRSLGLL